MNYKIDRFRVCLTPCPFGKSCKVSSSKCQECENFISYNRENLVLFCKKENEVQEKQTKKSKMQFISNSSSIDNSLIQQIDSLKLAMMSIHSHCKCEGISDKEKLDRILLTVNGYLN
jgi:hypothetical protein